MNMNFDVNQVFQNRLAASLGLDKYQYIMDRVKKTDVSKDSDFQKSFNGFYLIRRNEAWRNIYYEYFERVKSEIPTFSNIITYLYETTGNIEPSFSSKMLASIFPEKPIWDRYVVQNLNLKLEGATKQEKLENAIALYADIEVFYADFLKTEDPSSFLKNVKEEHIKTLQNGILYLDEENHHYILFDSYNKRILKNEK